MSDNLNNNNNTALYKLPDAILSKTILPFVGLGQYRYVAGVSRRFQACYETFTTGVREAGDGDDADGDDDNAVYAAENGHLEVLQWASRFLLISRKTILMPTGQILFCPCPRSRIRRCCLRFLCALHLLIALGVILVPCEVHGGLVVFPTPTSCRQSVETMETTGATTTLASDPPKSVYVVFHRREALQLPILLATAGFITAVAFSVPPAAQALSPSQAERQYDVYSSSYDQLDGGTASSLLGIEQARQDLLQLAKGNVLEIGVGTGLNLDKYPQTGQISSLTLVDISDGMLQEAKARLESLPDLLQNVSVQFVKADATSSDLVKMFGEGSFDTIVDSFSLCVMGNAGATKCLEQLSRVIKKKDGGGQILLLENSRSSNPLLGAYQDATADVAAVAGGKGCLYNQDVAALIRATGRLQIVQETSYATGLFRAFRCVRYKG